MILSILYQYSRLITPPGMNSTTDDARADAINAVDLTTRIGGVVAVTGGAKEDDARPAGKRKAAVRLAEAVVIGASITGADASG